MGWILIAVVVAFGCVVNPIAGVPVAAVPPALPGTAPLSRQPTPMVDRVQQGRALYETGRYAEAVTVLKQAVADYRAQGDDLRLAMALSNLALAYQQLGDWSNATQTVTQSLNVLNHQRSPEALYVLAQTLDVQGRLQLAIGQPEQAVTLWEQAAATYTQARDRVNASSPLKEGARLGAIRSQINQAQALQAAGFYRRSLDVLLNLNQTLQPLPDSITKAVGLRSLGEALQLVGKPDESRQALQQSLAITQRSAFAAEESATLLSLGNLAHAQQQPEAALAFYQQAAARSPDAMLQIQAQINRLSLLIDRGQTATVLPLSRQIQSQLDTLLASRAVIYARIHLAQGLLTVQRQQSEAPPVLSIAQLLAAAVEQAQHLGDRQAESYALGNLGGLYEQTHQWAESRDLTEKALLIAQELNATDIAYRWQWQLGRLLKQQGDVTRAIAAYEAAVSSLQSLRGDLVAVDREVQFNFRDSVEPVYRQTVELLLQSPETATAPNLDKARRLIESLQLAELDNFFREACLNAQSVLLDKVVDQENPTTAIVYPIILDSRLEVILKLPHQPLLHHTVSLPRQTIEPVLTQLQQKLKEPDSPRKTQALSQQVYNWLLQPVAIALKQSGVNTLVFVLDGALRNIPMAALYDGQQYLVENYAIALSPGLQLFAPQPLASVKLTALAAGLTQPPPGYAFDPLPEVKAELDLIEQAGVTTTKLLDQNFTRSALQQQMNASPFSVVHLATHGQFSSQAKDTFILAADGPINVSQFDQLLRSRGQTRPDALELLVLSACETAAGDNRATLGLAGLAVRAGARSTLASLWYVDDRFTALFMSAFYRELVHANVSKAEALRRAQITMLKTTASSYSQPLYWAPYVLVGNWL